MGRLTPTERVAYNLLEYLQDASSHNSSLPKQLGASMTHAEGVWVQELDLACAPTTPHPWRAALRCSAASGRAATVIPGGSFLARSRQLSGSALPGAGEGPLLARFRECSRADARPLIHSRRRALGRELLSRVIAIMSESKLGTLRLCLMVCCAGLCLSDPHPRAPAAGPLLPTSIPCQHKPSLKAPAGFRLTPSRAPPLSSPKAFSQLLELLENWSASACAAFQQREAWMRSYMSVYGSGRRQQLIFRVPDVIEPFVAGAKSDMRAAAQAAAQAAEAEAVAAAVAAGNAGAPSTARGQAGPLGGSSLLSQQQPCATSLVAVDASNLRLAAF